MRHILGTVLKENSAELFDDSDLKSKYEFMGLQAAIIEGTKRKELNPNIRQINIYKVYDGVRDTSPQGQYQLVYYV